MKVALLTESPADDAAMRIFVASVLGQDTEFVEPNLRSRGYSALLDSLAPVYKSLYYHLQAEALVVVVDSNGTPIDDKQPDSRRRELRERLEALGTEVTPVENRTPIKTAVGVAAPSIEGWLLFGQDSQCSEAAWQVARDSGKHSRAESLRLKELLYGTERPSLPVETEHMVTAARRIVDDKKLEALEQHYPWGFGSLMEALRDW